MACRANNQAAPKWGIARAGFTMMDLMVSIAVIAILIAILLPALSTAMESARRVKCQSQLREIGFAINDYVTDHIEQLPDSVHARATTYNGVRYPRFEQSIFVRMEKTSNALVRTDGWDGLGLLFHAPDGAEYMDTPEIMYCPSHSGDHNFRTQSAGWIAQDAQVAGNYQYRLPIYASRIHQLDQALALVSDGLREQSDYNHRVGNNLLKADLHVSWFNDATGKVYGELVTDGDSADARFAVAQAWGYLDLDPKRPVANPPQPRDRDNEGIFASIGSPTIRD